MAHLPILHRNTVSRWMIFFVSAEHAWAPLERDWVAQFYIFTTSWENLNPTFLISQLYGSWNEWVRHTQHHAMTSSFADIWNLLWIRSANGALLPPSLPSIWNCDLNVEDTFVLPSSSDFHSSLVVVPRPPPSILSVPSPSRCDVTGREVDPTFGYIKLTFGIPSEFAYGSTWKSHYRMSEYPCVGQVGGKIFIARHSVFWRSKLELITTIMNIHLESAKLPAATISVF